MNFSLRIPHYFIEIWTPLKPKCKNDTLIGDTCPNVAIWLVQDTYPKSDVIWKKENTKKCGDNLVPMNCPQTKTTRQGATFWDSHNPFLI